MAAVEMFIMKFNRVVLIDEDHPLAIAERERAVVSDESSTESTAPSAPSAARRARRREARDR